MLKVGGIKMTSDGAIAARTAWLSQPYIGSDHDCGIQAMSQEELDDQVIQMHNAGFQVAVISGRSSVAVEKRMAELGVKHMRLGVKDKSQQFAELLKTLGISAGSTACVGDDTPDRDIMSQAGLAIAVADAHADLDEVADWHTQKNGGEGAVREVCDLLLSARNA